jgi:hypothetical protein
MLGQESTGLLAQHLLLFRKLKIHGDGLIKESVAG